MNPIDKLTIPDIKMIDTWRELFSGYTGADGNRDFVFHPHLERKAPVKQVLGAWNYYKRDLYKLLGENLILKKKINLWVGDEPIFAQLKAIMNSTTFPQEFVEKVCDNLKCVKSPETRSVLRHLFYSHYLKSNCFGGDLLSRELIANCHKKLEFVDGFTIPIQENIKPMKILAKVADHFKLEGFEEFRIAHSQALNGATLSGNLCLSIHPLDYITMSDNSNNWVSCMSWRQEGCYRAGTLEMMNSPCVLVAYVEADSKRLKIGDYSWNSKKWRILTVVDETGIFPVKGYPYQNEELNLMVIDWIKELIAKNWNINTYTLDTAGEHCGGNVEYCHYDYPNLTINFQTDQMYNDFGASSILKACINTDIFTDDEGGGMELNYSGPCTCIWCGEEEIYLHNAVCCGDCLDQTRTCDHCGREVSLLHEGVHQYGKRRFCGECVDTFVKLDFITRERHPKDEMLKIIFLPNECYNDCITSAKVKYGYCAREVFESYDNPIFHAPKHDLSLKDMCVKVNDNWVLYLDGATDIISDHYYSDELVKTVFVDDHDQCEQMIRLKQEVLYDFRCGVLRNLIERIPWWIDSDQMAAYYDLQISNYADRLVEKF